MPLARYKTHVARLFRRAPWLAVLGHRVFSLRQARYAIGAVGVVFDDQGRILLLEHVFHPRYPWGLPGGWVDRNETPGEAVVRELREETGLCIRVVQPLLIELSAFHRSHLELAFLCQLEGGQVRLSGEILSYRWSDPADSPDLFEFHRRAVECALRVREANG